jgi:hypothetical protein
VASSARADATGGGSGEGADWGGSDVGEDGGEEVEEEEGERGNLLGRCGARWSGGEAGWRRCDGGDDSAYGSANEGMWGRTIGWGGARGGEHEVMRGRGAWGGECDAAPGERTFTCVKSSTKKNSPFHTF